VNADAAPYLPIACSEHERLELAVLRRQWLEVKVDAVSQRLLPRDVYARDGAEWLLAETDSGERRTLRLDRLQF
jgi:Rho-binding antiterminator